MLSDKQTAPREVSPVFFKDRTSRKLFDFHYVDNDRVSVYEVEYLDVPKTAPKSDRFQWYFADQGACKFEKLEFKSMSKDTREFANGSILDMTNLTFTNAEGKTFKVRQVV